MRTLALLTLIILLPVLAFADVQWHQFGRDGDKDTITVGGVTLIVERQTTANTGFRGDDLSITTRAPGPTKYYFTSSYGYGAVAIHRNILFLKYGIGRGTAGARVQHVKVLRLDSDLDELVDVQCSYYIVTNPHKASPDEFEYRLKVQTEGAYTILSFSLPKPQKGIPSEKIVTIKNDG